MSKKSAALLAMALLVVTLILFDVDINPTFSVPRDVEALDLKQESLFEDCVDERDRIIHAETFSGIDNPDVQREILATRKAGAVSECRLDFPERRVTTSEPLHFNLIDMTFRY